MSSFLTAGGYASLLVSMALDNLGVPLPSEVILPSAGYLVLTGNLHFWPAALMAVAGGVMGSGLAYALAEWGGRALVLRYGSRLGLESHSLGKAEKWFQRYGDRAVFFGRLLPLVRSYISFPAGLAAMSVGRFIFFTVLGLIPWTLGLMYAGLVLGHHLGALTSSFHVVEALVAVAVVLVLAVIWQRRR